MKKFISMMLIFITIILLNTIVFAESKLTWLENFTFDDSWPVEVTFNKEKFGTPQIGINDDLLLCSKSGTQLTSIMNFKKETAGNLYEKDKNYQSSYIVSETRRTGKYKIISGKNSVYSDQADDDYENMTSVYNAYEQQYAFWKNPSEAKKELNGGEYSGGADNSTLAQYTRGNELITEAKTIDDYLKVSNRKFTI